MLMSDWSSDVCSSVLALGAHGGDVLVFLPGRREIARVQGALDATTNRHPRASGDPAPFVPEAGPGSSAMTLGSCLRGNDSMGDRGSSLVPESPTTLPLHGDLPVDQQAQVLQDRKCTRLNSSH